MLQGLVFMFVAGMPIAAVFLLPKGLTADIADYDALVRDERREAMFYSTQNFFEKVTYSLPPLLLSLVLAAGRLSREPVGHPPGPSAGRRPRVGRRRPLAHVPPARHGKPPDCNRRRIDPHPVIGSPPPQQGRTLQTVTAAGLIPTR